MRARLSPSCWHRRHSIRRSLTRRRLRCEIDAHAALALTRKAALTAAWLSRFTKASTSLAGRVGLRIAF